MCSMKITSLLIMAAWMLVASSAFADAKMTGSTRFQFAAQNASVTFGCDRVQNTSKENATGTLMMRLWALDRPYTSGTISGKILASYKLEGLDAGCSYPNVSRTVATTLPSRRADYVLCLTLLEYKNGGYVIVDHRNFAGCTVLGPLPLFTMSGPWRWQTSNEGGTVDIEVAKISHTRTADTGTLKLSVWATDRPYRGGSIEGYQIGSVKKDPLKKGFQYTNVRNTAKYSKPPAGVYYVCIVLSEYSDNQYKIVSYLTSNSTSTFQ